MATYEGRGWVLAPLAKSFFHSYLALKRFHHCEAEFALRGCGLARRSALWQALPMAAANIFAYLDSRTERSGDEVSADRFRLIADKIEADPSLLQIPLDNIERWLSQGHSAVKRLEEWRTVILAAKASAEGMAHLLDLLRDQSWEVLLFKGFSPFPGILNKEELNRLSWTSRH